MFERLTEGSRRILSLAQGEARHFGRNYVGTEHLLLGLLLEEKGIAAETLRDFDITPKRVRERVESIIAGYGKRRSNEIGVAPSLSPYAERAMRGALREAL